MRVLFGPWTPDSPDLDSGGLEDCVNVIPRSDGSYGQIMIPTATPAATTLSGGAAQIMYIAAGVDGTEHAFVGSRNTGAGNRPNLFKVEFTATNYGLATNVSRTLTYTNSAVWSITSYGNTVLAANGVDAMQVYTIGTSTRFLDASASASAPVARALCTVRDFVMAGGIATEENKVQWCQINNPLRWTANPRLQSDSQVLPDTGDIMAMTGGDFVTILTEQAIWRGTYVGSPIIWRFDKVAPGIGCANRGSVAQYQNLTFFLAKSGFHVFDGTQAIPIGKGVDRYLDADALNLLSSGLHSAAIDFYNKLYVFTYTPIGAAGAYSTRMLLYNFVAQRWSRVDITFWTIGGSAKMLGSAPNPSSGEMGIVGINSDKLLYYYVGAAGPQTATFITGETQLIQDHRAFVSAVRPLIHAGANVPVTVKIGSRNRLDETVSYGAAVARNTNGLAPLRSDARYHRVRVDVSGSFTQAIGFDVDFRQAGKR